MRAETSAFILVCRGAASTVLSHDCVIQSALARAVPDASQSNRRQVASQNKTSGEWEGQIETTRRQSGSSKLEFSRNRHLAPSSAHASLTSPYCLWIPATSRVAHACGLKIAFLRCTLGTGSWRVGLIAPWCVFFQERERLLRCGCETIAEISTETTKSWTLFRAARTTLCVPNR